MTGERRTGSTVVPAVFLVDPDDPGENLKPGEVIRESGRRKSPAGSRGRAPGGG